MPSSTLTKGCVTKMFGGVAQLYAGEIPPLPIVQVLSIETFQVYKEGLLLPDPDRYKIAISDGEFALEGVVLTKNNNHLIDSNKVQVNSLICLKKFAFYEHYFIWEGPTYKNYVHMQVDNICVVKERFWRIGTPQILDTENIPKIRGTQTRQDFYEALRLMYYETPDKTKKISLPCVFRFIKWFMASVVQVVLQGPVFGLVVRPASFLFTVFLFLAVCAWTLLKALYVIPLTLWQYIIHWGSTVLKVGTCTCNQYPVSIENGKVIFTGKIKFPMKFNKIYVITEHQHPNNLKDCMNQFKYDIPAAQAKMYDGNGNKINVVLNLYYSWDSWDFALS